MTTLTSAELFAIDEEPEACEEGAKAYRDGVNINPYAEGDITRASAWDIGYTLAERSEL